MERSPDSPKLSFTSAGTEVELRSELTDEEQINAPKHPIPQLQGPFEESINEASQGAYQDWVVDLDAQSRRRDLLRNPQYERLCGRRWRQRAGERYHPFWKLAAQMSFALHLLVNGKAKSNAAVLRILQAHVDEMDGFVSRTTEDFLIIQIDLQTRIQYLSLPLENLDVFDEMLVDRAFRLAMIDYNEKIELAIERFTMAIDDALKDIQKGKEAIGGLWQYLRQSAKGNTPMTCSLIAIYNSMLANTEGWNSAFSKLRRKGVALQYAIKQLGRAITEMQRRVGVASRRDVVSFVQSPHPTVRAKSFKGLFNRGVSVYNPGPLAIEKPLPCDPALSKASKSRSRPSSSNKSRLAHQKSVPNLRATRESENCRRNEASDRARSVNGTPSRGSDSGSILPRIQKTISRRLSKAKLPTKVTVEEVAEEAPQRPSTSASRTLKSFRKSRYGLPQEPPQEPPPPPPNRMKRPVTANALARRETMKDQLLQYFKSDRVVDAWESITEKEKKPARSNSRKDGLWSKFQPKSSSVQPDEMQTNLYQTDIQKQMTWLEETKNLNIYSLKPKHVTAPRVHTITDHMSVQQQLEGEDSHYNGDGYSKTLEVEESIITALPTFPLPPIGYRLTIPPTSS
ncbi:hypothetical protein BDW59DRAFT_156740 [Aspergillus cavernicola]|uniref:Uncharacterized protein n=1 Tax=Aspergillus cavernicola TaxID=176166 RepID=A0ABR4IZU0_9EURO